MYKGFTVEDHGSAIIVRFTRPDVRSPLSIFVLEELSGLLDSISRPIVFTGSDGVFASGADLREIAGLTQNDAPEFSRRGQGLMNAIADRKSATVAAVNGYCLGGALDLALACHKRIASPDAVFAHPGADLGIVTGWGGTQRLPRLIGRGRALEMFFTARRVGADEALTIGLIDQISDDPVGAAVEFAATV